MIAIVLAWDRGRARLCDFLSIGNFMRQLVTNLLLLTAIAAGLLYLNPLGPGVLPIGPGVIGDVIDERMNEDGDERMNKDGDERMNEDGDVEDAGFDEEPLEEEADVEDAIQPDPTDAEDLDEEPQIDESGTEESAEDEPLESNADEGEPLEDEDAASLQTQNP